MTYFGIVKVWAVIERKSASCVADKKTCAKSTIPEKDAAKASSTGNEAVETRRGARAKVLLIVIHKIIPHGMIPTLSFSF